jgi:hypothetical protein
MYAVWVTTNGEGSVFNCRRAVSALNQAELPSFGHQKDLDLSEGPRQVEVGHASGVAGRSGASLTQRHRAEWYEQGAEAQDDRVADLSSSNWLALFFCAKRKLA